MKHVFPSDLIVENETTAALRRTLTFLEEHGWSQGRAWGPNGQACIASALAMVGGGLHSPAAKALRNVLGVDCIEFWNDRLSRTWPMIRDAFDKAIETSCRT